MPADLDALAAYCVEHGWRFDITDDMRLLIHLRLSYGASLCVASVQSGTFLFRSHFPFDIPETKRLLMAEFAARVNCQSPYGMLYFDPANGMVGVSTSIPLETGHLYSALVDLVVCRNLAAAERWLPGIAAVCFSDVSPKAAMVRCQPHDLIAAVVEEAIDRLNSNDDEESSSE